MLSICFSYAFYLILITSLVGVLPLYSIKEGIAHFYKWKKLQLREVRSLAQGHTANKWASQNLNSHVSDGKDVRHCTLYLQAFWWSGNICRLASAPHCLTPAFPSALPPLNRHGQLGGPKDPAHGKKHKQASFLFVLFVGCTNQLASILCIWAKT